MQMTQDGGEGDARADCSESEVQEALHESLGDANGGASDTTHDREESGDRDESYHFNDSRGVDDTGTCNGEDGDCDSDESDRDWQNFLAKYSTVVLPNGVLTVAEAIVGIVSYGAQSGLNWSQMEGLLKLSNFLVGKDALPETTYLLRKTWSTLKGRMIHHHLFCTVCNAYVGKPKEDLKCPSCSESIRNDLTQGNFFTTVDLKEQIAILLQNKTTAKSLLGALKRERVDGTLTDIVDGTLYQKEAAAGSWSDLTLTMNTDGARVFNSSKSSLWPLQCVVNELPIALRWSNVLLCGLWFGPGHPDMTMYLEQFVQEVGQVGVITWDCEGQAIQSRVRVVCCCVDAPARAAVLNAKQYNGYFGCSYCLQEGTFLNGGEPKDALHCGKPNTGPRTKRISMATLHNFPTAKKVRLLVDINTTWYTGIIPDQYKLSTLIPIPRPGKEQTTLADFRPVSLTSCICRMMERLLPSSIS
ncbi:hypothetical protein ISCGN_031936 [Ixodes scapularis]